MAQRITEARTAAHLTQVQLAEKVKVSRGAVNKWEKGDTKNLKLENLFALAEHTGHSAKWIALGTGARRETRSPQDGNLDVSFLTMTVQAVEKYLDNEDLTLDAEPRAKLIALLYEIYVDKGKVEQPAVGKYLRLVA